jgi:integrase
VLVTALDYADRRELVRRNVARLTRTPAGRKTERRSLTPDEARALVAAVAGDHLEALVIIGLTMGLRPGELTGLSWRDVDLDEGLLHVRRALLKENNRPVMGRLKTPQSRRSLACPPIVVEALRRRRDFQRLERAAAGLDWSEQWAPEELVFTTTNGTPIDASNLRRYLRSALRRAKLDRLTPYELRHTAASLLSDEGQPMERVADLLGHDGVRMLSEVYRHAVTPTVDVAAGPMERLMRATNGDSSAPQVAPLVGTDEAGNDDDQGDALVVPGGP